MSIITFPYKERENKILGRILRPLISLEVFSQTAKEWEIIDDVVVDTGADITTLPRFLAEPLVEDITAGEYVEIRGIAPGTTLVAFLHNLKMRINDKEFTTKVAIADSNDVPPLLGRFQALDLFEACFDGKELKLKS